MALGARLALYRRGVSVPGDVSLTGFDDVFTSSLMTPPLTTVRQAIYDIGLTAAREALNLLDGQPVVRQVFEPELIIRESTAPRRPRVRRAASGGGDGHEHPDG